MAISAVGIVADRVAIARQPVDEPERTLQRHVVPGPLKRLLGHVEHAVVDRAVGEFAEGLAVARQRGGIVAAHDQHAQVVDQDPPARRHFIGRERERTELGADRHDGGIAGIAVTLGGHHEVDLDAALRIGRQGPGSIAGDRDVAPRRCADLRALDH